jgi:hypothetical protein
MPHQKQNQKQITPRKQYQEQTPPQVQAQDLKKGQTRTHSTQH